MARSSINFQPAGSGAMRHNDRTIEREPEYLLPEKFRQKNEVDRPAKEAEELIKKLTEEARENFRQKFGQKLQTKKFVWEAVANLNREHTMEDVKRLVSAIEKETGFTCVQAAIHRDEGRVERGVPIRNYHAHLVFFTLDRRTGEQLYRKSLTERQKKERPDLRPMDRARLSKLQDITAEALAMKRGIKGSKRPRMGHKQYREAQRQKEAWKKFAKEEMAKVKDLKEENKRLRQELQEAGAKRPQYAALEAEVGRLKEQIKLKELTIEQMRAEMERLRVELLTKEPEQEVKELQAAIEAEKATNRTLTHQLAEKNAQIGSYEQKIEELKQEVGHWKGIGERLAELVDRLTEHFMPRVYKLLGRLPGIDARLKKIEEELEELEQKEKIHFPPMEGYYSNDPGPGFGGKTP